MRTDFQSIILNLQLYWAEQGCVILQPIVTRLRPEWDSVLRFHPNLPYHDEDGLFIDSYPALLGKIVTQQGRSATFHRIYLSEDGFKAPVEKPKKMMPIPSDPLITNCF